MLGAAMEDSKKGGDSKATSKTDEDLLIAFQVLGEVLVSEQWRLPSLRAVFLVLSRQRCLRNYVTGRMTVGALTSSSAW